MKREDVNKFFRQKCLSIRHTMLELPSVFLVAVGNSRAWLSYTGTLSEEGLLVYLRVLQTFLPQLPVSPASTSCQDSASDSEDESEGTDKQMSAPVSPVGPRVSGRAAVWTASRDSRPF